MSYAVNWLTKVIEVPASDMVLVSANYYALDLALFHKEIRRLEWDEGLWAIQILDHTNSKPSFAGASYAAFDEIINGYTVQFELGIERVDLVGSNNNIIDVLNYSGTGVVPTNSAGLQDLGTLLASAYSGQIVVDGLNGFDGTSVPVGTYNKPVRTIKDAIAIANRVGVRSFLLTRSTAINEDLSAEYKLIGDSPFNVVTCNAIANLIGCSLENLTVVGELDGLNVLTRCSIATVTGLSGFIEKCAFSSTVGMVGNTYIHECYSQSEGMGFAEFIPLGNNLVMRDFHGSVKLSSVTGGIHSIEINGGRLVLDSLSCTGGTIYARGKPFEIIGAGAAGTVVVEQFDRGLSTEQDAKLSDIHSEVQYIERWIHLDTEQLTQGIGTQEKPFNTLDAALTYMEANNFLRLHTVSDLTIDRQLKNFVVIGIGNPSIDFNGQNLSGSEFQNCTLKGLKTGVITADNCDLFEGVQVQGRVRRCAFLGTVEQTGDTDYSGCYSGITGLGYPQLKITAGNAGVRGFIGSIGVTGVTTGDHSIGIGSDGRLLADATCTGGIVHFRGFPFEIVDNSGVGCATFDETESEKVSSIPTTSSGLTTEESTKLLSLPQKEDNATHLLKEVQLIVGN